MTMAIPDDSASCLDAASDPILSVSHLAKTYARAAGPALDDLSLTVRRGEIYGLLGPNGAGKTTAISIMSTLFRPSAGTVSICGLDSVRNTRRIRTRIGVVPQEIALFETLTARENLFYFGRMHGLSGSRLNEAVVAGLAVAGLAERADEPVKHFSGGMKRRANLAVGLLHGPELLFLDEPTVGIDAQSRNLILEKLTALRETGITMVYTTHYMEEAEQICSRIGIIDRGRLVAEGTARSLIDDRSDCGNLGDLFLKLTGRQLRD